jgi:hypothetical protein
MANCDPIFKAFDQEITSKYSQQNGESREFMDWFTQRGKSQPQLPRLVRYLKAWADYQNAQPGVPTMPSGQVLTIWAAENAHYNELDDVALRDTLQAIRETLSMYFECSNPTFPAGPDLVEQYQFKSFFKSRLEAFLESAKQAVNETNQKLACGKWQMHLGTGFPCRLAEDKDAGARTFEKPAVITENAKSA